MSPRVPERSQQSYRHEALLWHDRDDFTRNLVPFVDEGWSWVSRFWWR